MNTPPLLFGRKGRNAPCALSSRLSLSPYAHGAIGCGKKKARKEISLQAQSVKKVEVQEALPPAGVIGAAPLTLVPQHFPRKPA